VAHGLTVGQHPGSSLKQKNGGNRKNARGWGGKQGGTNTDTRKRLRSTEIKKNCESGRNNAAQGDGRPEKALGGNRNAPEQERLWNVPSRKRGRGGRRGKREYETPSVPGKV